MNAGWIYPFIILGGALQTCGAAMNAQLVQSVGNRWLANAVSFALILAFFACVFAMFPHRFRQAKGWRRCHGGPL
jgi:transporter family-2 protein